MSKPIKRDKSSQCDGKRRFASRSEAQSHSFPSDSAYRCPHCREWHLTGAGFFRPKRPGSRTHQLHTGFDA